MESQCRVHVHSIQCLWERELLDGELYIGDGEGGVMVLVSGRMWPGTFKCSFCDSQFPLSTALLTVSTVHMKLLTVEYH